MPTRSAACEPCRIAKVACDHQRPVCSRCRERNSGATCEYRERPFKRRRTNALPTDQSTEILETQVAASLPPAHTPARNYPNPGYLGATSHVEIYEHLVHLEDGTDHCPPFDAQPLLRQHHTASINDPHIARGARLLAEIRSLQEMTRMRSLVYAWLATGVSLALAGPLIRPCVDTIGDFLHASGRDDKKVAEDMLIRSCRSIPFHVDTTLEQFCAHLTAPSPRWEAVGLFFVTVVRAASDQPQFLPLYENSEERRKIQHIALHLADQCLELVLSLDCLNDVQLILQYENFISHSIMDGDQSYHAWRRLGDVVSSLYALGYHQSLESDGECPQFLRNLRRAAFARAYSADKNVSIFLGRPPRINQSHCQPELRDYFTFEHDKDVGCPTSNDCWFQWDKSFNYDMETQWSANCAFLKEQILDIPRKPDYAERVALVDKLESECKMLWQALPAHFRLDTDLSLCDGKPIERDFKCSARLNYLHVHFLLRRAIVRRRTEPDDQLIKVSAEILGLAVESLVLQHQLANSGTKVIWRLAYYGLPAAGIICICLLNDVNQISKANLSLPSVIQDLSVLVAQIETGAVVGFGDPNFALLAEAARTIKTLLETFIMKGMRSPPTSHREDDSMQTRTIAGDYDALPWAGSQDIPEFDVDFWTNLLNMPNNELAES